ncbi:hypothetical protein [Nocardia gamkensis]|uniref:hypothetical protein n=1 Tax=Nocardia gamkensis TaxID=352869 RepID=UPI0037C9E094
MTATPHHRTQSPNADRLRLDFQTLRVSLWSCVAYCTLGLVGFAGLAGFWPPPAEYLNAPEITEYFTQNQTRITLGMILMAAGAPFYYVWSVVLSKIITRIEGPMGPLANIERLGGLLTALVTVVPAVIWLTIAFRLEARSPESVQLFYDFGWIFFDLTFACSVLQSVAMGVAILRDVRPVPLFPKWTAWICFVTAATYVPLVLVPLVTDGPFAWHGLISFWAVFVMFFVMIAVLTPYAWTALGRIRDEMLAEAE